MSADTEKSNPVALRRAVARVNSRLFLVVAAFALISPAVGTLVSGVPGLVSGALAAGAVALMAAVTAIGIARGANDPMIAGAWMMGGFIVKLVLLGALFLTVRAVGGADMRFLAIVVGLGVLAIVAVEVTVLTRSRIPTVDPATDE